MRYDDWDVILFPTGRDSKIPIKEFRVACHVVPDIELVHIHGAVGIPVMTCFVPSLMPGTAFQISIHCWRTPSLSQFSRTYSKHTELIKFEARILIDGRLVASTVLDREVNGPHLITSTCEFTKTGELERLRFPHFRRELLYQNHWRPGDDIGRIKIVISEGFPRDSLSAPIERVKNIVAFSFQHAPLEILESNGIAWPNQSMWQCSGLNPVVPVPTYQLEDGPSSHAHSPGRKSIPLRNIKNHGFPTPFPVSSVFHNQTGAEFFGNAPAHMSYLGSSSTGSANTPSYSDPFTDSAYLSWANALMNSQTADTWDGASTWPISGQGQRNCPSDTIMPDYAPPQTTDPMHISGPSLEDEPMSLKVPTNTPTGETDEGEDTPLQVKPPTVLPSDLATSLTRSLLNQPFPLPVHHCNPTLPATNSKVNKDRQQASLSQSNTREPTVATSSSSTSSCGEFACMGANIGSDHSGTSLSSLGNTSSGPAEPSSSSGQSGSSALGGSKTTNNGTAPKRLRNFTPTSVKAIDEEDEPRRTSPHTRPPGYGVIDILSDIGQ